MNMKNSSPGTMPTRNILPNKYLICLGKFNMVMVIGHIEYDVLFLLNGFIPSKDD